MSFIYSECLSANFSENFLPIYPSILSSEPIECACVVAVEEDTILTVSVCVFCCHANRFKLLERALRLL